MCVREHILSNTPTLILILTPCWALAPFHLNIFCGQRMQITIKFPTKKRGSFKILCHSTASLVVVFAALLSFCFDFFFYISLSNVPSPALFPAIERTLRLLLFSTQLIFVCNKYSPLLLLRFLLLFVRYAVCRMPCQSKWNCLFSLFLFDNAQRCRNRRVLIYKRWTQRIRCVISFWWIWHLQCVAWYL